MKIHQMLQTSPEWWEVRRGKPTASDFDKILTPAKAEPSASQDKYIAQLLACVVNPEANYFGHGVHRPTASMQAGTDTEPAARRWYELETNQTVQMVGFIESDCGRYGCSPDGVIGLQEGDLGASIEGCLELKCPDLDTHLCYLLKGKLPLEYKCQVHGQLLVTGAKWVDFMSYAHGVNPLLLRVYPDDFTAKLKAELERFLARYLEAAKKVGVLLGGEAVTADGEVLEPSF